MPPTMTEFTPWASLFGGGLIGLSAVMVMAFFGRVAGISGITVGALPSIRSDWSWRLAFLIGLVAAPLLLVLLTGEPVVQTVSDNLGVMILAGLLVGFGTIWGSGCTSGHGVCGLARLSTRSLVAVATFMTTAFLTVLFLRHILG
ncbi:YeeE/YedE thiosulfate transporter family protein [Aurantimonas sp. C2-6-R+9]|uniref:YeeE/YedE family protein n=1 Tax=unclassified Aurantimonas TaxID=2638230 RepID=UPI002E181649|nr:MULTISPECIES: YeeE/YedE thiosulfate transporter family protein [unclassified Aurantimonas]MEC5290194.1 YeeE/YedE thiosulfate transporter family protein [Aurantimonas sp. C2-3-R2]MEC5380305.1 YeeE/YedE thiosulfate transporter family protein [Aurantimonas sp. C2-6-R+9]MEC5411258.1 YeeE/YedE thiosulfate transporter family protein [Aurantimonas sp. C2-4-R8]